MELTARSSPQNPVASRDGICCGIGGRSRRRAVASAKQVISVVEQVSTNFFQSLVAHFARVIGGVKPKEPKMLDRHMCDPDRRFLVLLKIFHLFT